MTRKLLPLVLILSLAAAACGAPPNPQVDFGSGVRFVPMVADSLNDAGRHPSVVVDGQGLPVVGYFGFPEDSPEEALPAARPVGAPSIPGVLMATGGESGLWTRGAMALEEEIPNVEIPFNPAPEPSVAELTPDGVTGLQMVADGETFHAAWGSADGLFYATGSLDPDAGSQVQLVKVADTPPTGPSIAVDADGTPWIAYYTSASEGATIELATPDGVRWSVDTIAEAAGCETCRTAAIDGPDGIAVAYSDGGSEVSLATNGGAGGWQSIQVAADGGQGLSGAPTEGGYALAFYDPAGQVTVLTGTPGSFRAEAVSQTLSSDSASAPGAGTSIAVDDAGTIWAAWHDASTGVGFSSGDGGTFTQIDTAGTTANGAMPAVAVAPDGSVAYVSWYEPDTQDLLVGAYGDLSGLAIAGEPGAGTPPTEGPTRPTGPTGGPTTGPPACEPDGTTLAIAAPVGAAASGFDQDCLAVPAGEPFTIEFDNQDTGVQHNVAIYSADPMADPSAESFFVGDIGVGPDTMTYEVDALQEGTYFFRCDVHPTTMTGTFVVGGGGGGGATGPTGATGGGGAGALTVTAAALAFDTSEIRLAAEQETVITFVNDDAGVQHNIAIYTDDSLTEELFSGDLVTGPATIDYAIPALPPGEYYFLCIVHPNMNGTVIVG